MVNFFLQGLLVLRKRNHSFKVSICLLWADLRMIHDGLGIWEIRHESIIFFCSFICNKQVHITLIIFSYACILKMIFSLSLSIIHNALISMCQRIAEKKPTMQLRASVEHFNSKSDFFFIKIQIRGWIIPEASSLLLRIYVRNHSYGCILQSNIIEQFLFASVDISDHSESY